MFHTLKELKYKTKNFSREKEIISFKKSQWGRGCLDGSGG